MKNRVFEQPSFTAPPKYKFFEGDYYEALKKLEDESRVPVTTEDVLIERLHSRYNNDRNLFLNNTITTGDLLVTGFNPSVYNGKESLILHSDSLGASRIRKDKVSSLTNDQFEQLVNYGEGLLLSQNHHKNSGYRISLDNDIINLSALSYLTNDNNKLIDNYKSLVDTFHPGQGFMAFEGPLDRHNLPGFVYALTLAPVTGSEFGYLKDVPLKFDPKATVNMSFYYTDDISHSLVGKIHKD